MISTGIVKIWLFPVSETEIQSGSEQKRDDYQSCRMLLFSKAMECWGCARELFILSSLQVFVIWWGNRQTSYHSRLGQVIAAPGRQDEYQPRILSKCYVVQGLIFC